MLKPVIEKALNEQVGVEYYSAYLYLSMAAYCQRHNLPGFANWLMVQHQEEMTHVIKLYHYILDRGGQVVLPAIDAPASSWDSPQAVFAETLEHERSISERIYKLVDLALAERDHATNALLQWYVSEQVEEEANVELVLDQIRMVGAAKDSLFLLDRELAKRTFAAPATA